MRRLSIGQFSQATRLSIKALRLYADNGVLPPTHVDTATGYRFYDTTQIERAEHIKWLRGVGMPLSDIQALLDAPTLSAQLNALDQHAALLTQQLDQLSSFRLRLLAAAATPTPPLRPLPPDVQVVAVPALCIAGVRITTSLAHIASHIRTAFAALHRGLTTSPLPTTGTPMIIYHDLIDEVSDGDVEVCVPIQDSVSAHPTLVVRRLEGGTVAALVHRGPYEQIASAYQALLGEMSSRGLEPIGPPREIYLSDPATTPPDALLTRIEFPVATSA